MAEHKIDPASNSQTPVRHKLAPNAWGPDYIKIPACYTAGRERPVHLAAAATPAALALYVEIARPAAAAACLLACHY